VITLLTQFGSEEAGGLSSLGLNVKAFLFQLITFVLVLVLLRKYVYSKLVDTLEERRTAVIDSLDQAKKAAEDLEKAEANVEALLVEARQEAADIVATAHKEAVVMVETAEEKSRKKAEHLVSEARAQLEQDVLKARDELKRETKTLVALATERIIGLKLTSTGDEALIEQAIKESK
jgi:F-type H+-transporting ATPase subunit b